MSKHSKNNMDMLCMAIIFLLLVNLGMSIYSMYSESNKSSKKERYQDGQPCCEGDVDRGQCDPSC